MAAVLGGAILRVGEAFGLGRLARDLLTDPPGHRYPGQAILLPEEIP
jgi:hypothetical protein